MNQITGYITKINTRDYNSQCKYIKKKLLSVNSKDITVLYFLKSYV